MDYFKQRRAYRKLKRDQIDISTGQNNLYRELLDYANDEYQLDNQFTLKNSALLDLTGLSESGLKKVRNELVQLGLIEYVPGKKNKQKPKYQIKKLYVTSWDTKTQSSGSTGVSTSSPTGNPTSGLTGNSEVLTNNLTNIPTNNNHDDQSDNQLKRLFEIYSQEISVISPTTRQLVFDSIKDFTDQGTAEDEASQIVIHAIKIMAENNAKSWKYVQAILNNWLSHSLFTLDNIKAYQAKSRKPKQNYSKYKAKPKETGTDWSQVKAKEPANNPSDLQARLARMRGEENATN